MKAKSKANPSDKSKFTSSYLSSGSQWSISHQDLKLVKENERLQKQIKQLNDSLRKAKDSKNAMYFRNDRKSTELKKVVKEKEKLLQK